MNVEWRREPPSRAVLEVEVPADEVARQVADSAARLGRRVRVPGFRPGKAPRAVLERYVGREEVYAEATEALIAEGYRRAVLEIGIVPVGRPEFDVPPLQEGQPLRFTVRVDIRPEVDPGPYHQVHVPYQPREITDADVDAAIEDLRRRRARLISVAEPAANGDFVLVRPTEVVGYDRFQVDREVLVEIGSGIFPQAVEQGLAGASAGETRTVEEGDRRLGVQVVDVRRRDLPALDEAFARSVADVPTVDALRQRLRERLANAAEIESREAYEEAVVAAVLEAATVELPRSLVEHEIDHLVGDLADSLARRGYTLDRYLESAGKTLEALREEVRPRAERRLRARFVLDEIARREGLVPTQEEIAAEEEKVAAELKLDPQRVGEWLDREGRREAMLAMLRRRKTVAMLVARAQGRPAA